MGLFNDKKVVVVASVAYNLAGDETQRPNYLKSLIAKYALSGGQGSVSDTITHGYMKGPGMKLRTFFRWAEREGNYEHVGLPKATISGFERIDSSLVQDALLVDGNPVWVSAAYAGPFNAQYWAEQYILENRPEDLEGDWLAEFQEDFGLFIMFDTLGLDYVLLEVPDFEQGAQYLYVYYREYDYNEDDLGEFSGPLRLTIYKVGSGNTVLDNLANTSAVNGQFFPFIPIRIENEFLSEEYFPDAYEQAQKAYKKLTGASLDELIEQVADNDDLDKIDYAYIVMGAAFNSKEPAARKYIYKFFESLQQSQMGGPNVYSQVLATLMANEEQRANWLAWADYINNNYGSPGYVEPPEPPFPNFGYYPLNEIRIATEDADNAVTKAFDMRIQWRYVSNGDGYGLAKAGAKPGDCWFETYGTETYVTGVTKHARIKDDASGYEYTHIEVPRDTIDVIRLYWQRTDNYYTYLEVRGAIHKNHIYGGHVIETYASDALEETDESGYIIPLHYPTWKDFSLKDASQMATACVYIVFNCYEIHRIRWYQRGIFRIFLVLIIAVAAAFIFPAAGGLLGSNLLIGVSMGFSGMTAVIVGAVVNTMAALVLTMLLEKVASSFGVLGPVVAFFFGILVGGMIQGFQTNTLALNWGDLLKADNLLRLTNAIGSSVVKAIELDTAGIYSDMVDFAKKAEEEAKRIQEAYFKEFGYGAAVIDPMMFVDSSPIIAESSDTFLTRTLMTGIDIANMSMDLLYDFPELSLKLPDAFT